MDPPSSSLTHVPFELVPRILSFSTADPGRLNINKTLHMCVAIVLGSENNNYTCKLHLKSFIKLTQGVLFFRGSAKFTGRLACVTSVSV